MAKYYIQSGTLQYILSTKKNVFDATMQSLWELNDNDTLDEYFYVDERGFRDYTTAGPDTIVFNTKHVLKSAGWILP